ncbi:MAG: serine/threonine protein kinase [Thermomonas sp.]|nr:serine/threonine protein kinase [Thermomonas sp.]
MDAEQLQRWREADRLFSAWLDQDAGGRDAWLERQMLEAPVREALQRLIDQHLRGDPSLPAIDRLSAAEPQAAAPRNQLAGRRVGNWQLIEEIGRGGMSVVYRARRLEVDFEQIAAVKLLGLAALGSEGSTRFEQERRVLARLRHPHIAALIDGGFAEDGTPFLAMALVEGETLAKHCEQRQLDWRARVRLMIQVCDAVAHAHRNLLVHRDLKPANIMVTAEGVPVLLDFGIAKLLDDGREDTRTGMRALTPGYAAPEQRDGGQITTATDVYALGVILRELCAGSASLPQDLRNIIAMALREDAARRYPDARALGEDLERLLAHRAVRATPDSATYRVRAFLRRRRGLALGVASVVLALVVGMGLALWQAQRASQQAREALRQAARAEAARDFLFSMIAAGDRERTEAVDPPVSDVIARGVATLQDAPPDDPELLAEMATLLGHMDTSIGKHQRAGELLDMALASAQRTSDPALLANVRIRQGILANAEGEAQRAIEYFETALGDVARVGPARREPLLAAALGGWAYAMSNVGRGEEAYARLATTLATPGMIPRAEWRAELLLAQTIVTADPSARLEILDAVQQLYTGIEPKPIDRLALASMRSQTLSQVGKPVEAVQFAQEAAALADRVHPGNSIRRARIYNNLGSLLATANRMGDAVAAFGVAEAIYRAQGDEDSPAFAALVHNRGVQLRDLGAAELGLPLIEQAHAMASAQFGPADRRTLIALRNAAYARVDASRDPRADREWREVLRQAPADQPPLERFSLLLVGAHIATLLGDGRAAAQRMAEAEALVETHALELAPVLKVRFQTLAGASRSLAREAASADRHFEEAARLVAEAGDGAWSAAWRNHLAWAEHLSRSGRAAQASAQYALALALLEAQGAGLDSRLRQQLRAGAGSGTAPIQSARDRS